MSNESSERICPECGHGESMWDEDLGCQGSDLAFPDRPGIPCGHRCVPDKQKLLMLVKSIAFHPDDHDTEVSFYAPGDDFALIKFHDTEYEIRERRRCPTTAEAEPDKTQFITRSFTFMENKNHSVRLINRDSQRCD